MLDLLILAAFVVYGIASGMRARGKASESLDEYFLAGRSLRGWQAGTSMAATQFAADTPLLVIGLVATAGIFALWRLWIYGLAFLAMAFVFARLWRRAGVLTDAELTRVRYSGRAVLPLRLIKAVYYGTVINCVVLAVVLVAAMRIAEVFLPWHEWLAIALGLLVLYPFSAADAQAAGFAAEREMTFVRGIEELLPPGVRGLMLVGLLATQASTVDTHLNWGASYWSNDVYAAGVCGHWLRRTPTHREQVVVARLSNLLVLGIALVVMVHLGSIQTVWFISLLFGAGMGSVLVLRWLWERINLYSELAAMTVSLVTAPLLLYTLGTDPEQEWIRLGLMALVTTSAAVVAALLAPPTSDATLKAFYMRVRPVGWWGRTARLCGEDGRAPLRALGRSALLVLAAAGSLFALLRGFASLLFVQEEVSRWSSWGWIALGVALASVWLPSLGVRVHADNSTRS